MGHCRSLSSLPVAPESGSGAQSLTSGEKVIFSRTLQTCLYTALPPITQAHLSHLHDQVPAALRPKGGRERNEALSNSSRAGLGSLGLCLASISHGLLKARLHFLIPRQADCGHKELKFQGQTRLVWFWSAPPGSIALGPTALNSFPPSSGS